MNTIKDSGILYFPVKFSGLCNSLNTQINQKTVKYGYLRKISIGPTWQKSGACSKLNLTSTVSEDL